MHSRGDYAKGGEDLRIALLHPSLAITGGAERLTLDLAEQLTASGHSVEVFTGAYDAAKWGRADARGAAIRLLDARVDFVDGASIADWRRAGATLASELERFDLVVAGLFPSNIWWVEALHANPNLGRVPSIWYCHGFVGWDYPEIAERALVALRERQAIVAPPRRESRVELTWRLLREHGLAWVVRKIARLAVGGSKHAFLDARKALSAEAARSFTRVLANSEFTAGNVRAAFGVEATPCRPGIDVPVLAFDDDDAGRRNPRALLSVARLDDSKNVLSVLQALALLKTQGRCGDVTHTIVGHGPDEGRLRGFAEANGLTDRVSFAGEVTGEALEELYSTSGLFVLPCVDEGFGLVFVEAGVRGLPLLGPAQGGPAELIADGETGISVDPLDVEAIAGAIARAVSGETDLRRLAAGMSALVEREYTLERFAERFERQIADTIAAARSGSDPSEAEAVGDGV